MGDAVVLAGIRHGTQVKAKVLQVRYPAKPTSAYDAPSSDHVYAAVKLRLTNVGTTTFNESPSPMLC